MPPSQTVTHVGVWMKSLKKLWLQEKLSWDNLKFYFQVFLKKKGEVMKSRWERKSSVSTHPLFWLEIGGDPSSNLGRGVYVAVSHIYSRGSLNSNGFYIRIRAFLKFRINEQSEFKENFTEWELGQGVYVFRKEFKVNFKKR